MAVTVNATRGGQATVNVLGDRLLTTQSIAPVRTAQWTRRVASTGEPGASTMRRAGASADDRRRGAPARPAIGLYWY